MASREYIALASQLGTIGSACLSQGGVVIESSQDRDLGPFMRRNPATAGGVCKALSLYWIGMHAKEESFWDWLGTQGAIKTLSAESVMATFLSYGSHLANFDRANPTSSNAEYDAQKDVWANNVLGKYKVVPYTSITGKSVAKISGGLDVVTKVAFAVINNTDVYMQLSLGGTAGRHAVSLYSGSKDVNFYDPNYGEYWFPHKTALATWLGNFMRITGYSRALGADYTIRYYKKG
jgi:YopT peptidase